MKTSRLLASRNTSEVGILTSAGRSRPGGGRSRVRSISVCELGLAFARDRDLGRAAALRVVAQRFVDLAAGRVQLGRELVFDQRLLRACPVAARRRPRLEVIRDGAQLGALEAERARRHRRDARAAPWCTRRPRGRSPAACSACFGRGAARRSVAHPPASSARTSATSEQLASSAGRNQ